MKNLIILFLLFSALSLGASESATEDWQVALSFYENAENNIRTGKNSEAIVLLNTCVLRLRGLQHKHPDWNKDVVKNRLRMALARVDAVEGLIRAKKQSLSKDELLRELQETLVRETRYKKAMLIIHEQHKQTKILLKLKQRDLDDARQAASGKVVNQGQLDTFSFENLKLRKRVQELQVKIELLNKTIAKKSLDNGTAKLTKSLEEQVLINRIQKKALANERLKNQQTQDDLSKKLQLISTKYRKLLSGQKKQKEGIQERLDLVELQEADLQREKTKLNQQKLATQKLDNTKLIQQKLVSQRLEKKLLLSQNRIKDYQTAEKNYLTKLESVKSNQVDPKAFIRMTKENLSLRTENNRLKKVEIDFSLKEKTYKDEANKKAQLLKKHMNDHGKITAKLQQQVQELKSKINAVNKKNLLASSNLIQLNSKLSAIENKLKLQDTTIDELKDKIVKNKVSKPSANDTLNQAYAKNEKELTAKLKFANEKVAQLERQNHTLKNETIVGDEEMIRKYIQVRNELKKYKENIKELNGADDQGKKQILETVISNEDKKVNEQRRQINDFLFKAQEAAKNNNIQIAIGLYSEALKINRNNFDALLRLGLLHYQRRDFHDAKIHLNKAFYLNPDNPQVLMALGVAELELAHLELAVSFLGRLVGIKPKDATARLQLGITLHGLGWHEAAIVQLKKACEFDSKNSAAAFNLAMAYLSLTDPKIKEAQENYQRAVKLGIVRDSQLEKFFKQQQE